MKITWITRSFYYMLAALVALIWLGPVLIFLLPAFDAACGEMMMLLPCPTPPAGFTERKIAMPNERIPPRGNPRNFDVVLDVPLSQSCLPSHESRIRARPNLHTDTNPPHQHFYAACTRDGPIDIYSVEFRYFLFTGVAVSHLQARLTISSDGSLLN